MLEQAEAPVTGEPTPARQKRDREATHRRLLEAARTLFGEHGYDGVTVRMIASAADANVALVHRYFGSKAALFGAVLESEYVIQRVIAGEGDDEPLPLRLARHFVRQARRGPSSPVPRMLDRSVGNPEVTGILREHIERLIVEPLVAQLSGPDARTRAMLAVTIIMGAGPVRRVLGLDDLLHTDPEELTTRVAAMFETALAPLR
ncbi:TetR family transcriptional regulator [Actinomadura sp. NBRC 104412]|uniref:TetR/AcrR family transcriptional regulator n=1 Tax=Actinomadura sp. NBRC 104412 TaxID=3032203 RepID=UPI0024A494B2|nr:TetR/AcrR family transcriptional regulator [Actinomadura sp. NBRC 104412]GLZ06451.1 TetR family transcriptional regulator [Actinomadura sp. NBRC 104412]